MWLLLGFSTELDLFCSLNMIGNDDGCMRCNSGTDCVLNLLSECSQACDIPCLGAGHVAHKHCLMFPSLQGRQGQ